MISLCKDFIHYSVQYIQIESPFCKLFTPLNSLESREVSSVDMGTVSNELKLYVRRCKDLEKYQME